MEHGPSSFSEEPAPPSVRPRAVRTTITVIAIAYSLFTIYAAGFARLFNMDQMVIHLGFALLIVFLHYPVSARAPGWLDAMISFAAIGAAAMALYNVYAGWATGEILSRLGSPTAYDVAMGLALVAVILEACRRVAGAILPVLILLLAAHAVLADKLPGVLQSRGYSWSTLINQMYLANEGIFGLPLNASATTIAVFMVFTGFLLVSGAGEFFVDIALAAFGRHRGGAAKSAVVASGLFGMVTGSAIANTVTIGGFTIPLLKRSGYAPHVAAAIESTASVGGQIAPPIMGAAAFIMADLLGIPYLSIAAAAIIPALLYYAALFWMVDSIASRDRIDMAASTDLPRVMQVLRRRGHLATPFIVLVLVVVIFDKSIAQAGVWAIAATLLVTAFRLETRLGYRKLLRALSIGGMNIVSIAIITGAVGMIVGLFSLTGMGLLLTGLLTGLAGDNVYLLLIIGALAALILGTGLPTVPTYIVLAVVLAPALIQQGIPPLAAHMFIFYFGIVSDLTPPTALAPVTAAGIANANPWKTMNMAFVLGSNGYLIPFMFAQSPAFLLIGTPMAIIVALTIGLVETLALAGVVIGHLFGRKLGWLDRIVLLAGALLLIDPSTWTRVTGLLLVALGFILAERRHRRAAVEA